MVAVGFIPNAYSQNCVELRNCPTDSPILTQFVFSFTELVGDFYYLIVWGSVLTVLYMRTGNGILVSIVGLIIASLLTAYISIDTSEGSAIYWGYVMVGVSFGIGVYYIIRQKTANPQG